MIISRAPLRMSFAGGGSDLPAYYREFGGAVLSAAINKYVYVNVNQKFDSGIRVGYSKNEEVKKVADIAHPLVRNALEYLQIPGGVEITTIADIPSSGTGLGSSSTFTVGLLHALNEYRGQEMDASALAQGACHIEIDLCAEPIGKQDQYAAAFGGMNFIEFGTDESVIVTPISASAKTIQDLQAHLLLLYTGKTRSASALLQEQSIELGRDLHKQQSMHRMVQLARDLKDELCANRMDAVGEILHEGWILKKSLVQGISAHEIDLWYDAARSAGALGGKILGAGAGGFLLLYAPPERHPAILQALPQLQPISVGFDVLGSQIIFNEKIAGNALP
jgi:D-glycero-alpha-D-manno-heptose-7-phosphate kinase